MGYGFDGLGLVCLLGLAVGPLFHFCTIDPTQTTARYLAGIPSISRRIGIQRGRYV